jgi:AcrR family transcriptional regulator
MYRYFRGKEALFDKLVDIATIISAIVVFLSIDSVGITKEINDIPTITNGITASTSIIVAATGLVLTFANTHKLIQRNKAWADRIYYTFAFVLMAIGFVFLTYVALMWGDYIKAIRTGMAGLVIASATFANFTFLVLRRYIEPTLPK